MDATSIFEILAREHTPMLLAYLHSSVSEPSAVDDLYQETMLIAWRKLDEYDMDRPFGAWVRGIARNLVRQHARTQQNHAVLLDPSAWDWLNQQFAAIERRGGDTFSEKIQMLRDCIAALPEPYRQVIELRYQQEQNLDSMGSRLPIPRETIKKRLVRAKMRLSDCLQRGLQIAEGLG